MPNWDDQFDFDDLDDNKKNNKNTNKSKNKKTINDDDDFFDTDLTKNKKKQPQSTLPTINSRNSAKVIKQKQQSSSKQNPYAGKNLGGKQTNNNDYDYQFQQQIAQQPVSSKKQLKKNSQKQIFSNMNKKDAKVLQNKSNITEQYKDQYEQQYDFQEPIQQSTKKIPLENKNKTQTNQTKLPVSQKSPVNKLNINQNIKNTNKSPTKKQQQNQYEEQFEDDYQNEDFEQSSKSPQKITSNSQPVTQPKMSLQLKSNQNIKNTNSTHQNNKLAVKDKLKEAENRSKSVLPPKVPAEPKVTKNTVLSNKNINKIQSHSVNKKLLRSNSRKSIRSNDQKSIKGSRVTQKNQSQYFPNKHSDMVERSFPQDQDKLNLLNQVEINKINEKMRAMIRKFNQQLNDLINKNMILLKNKANQKQSSLDQRIRELQIQKKSGQTAIQVMEKDFQKLHGRQGQLKQEEYQLILQKQIQQKRNQIKQTTKEITVLKRVVDTKGKKLSYKQQEQKNAQNIHHLKTFLIQLKKDEQRSQQRLQKLASTQEQLETKISDMDYKLEQLLSQAKQKGVNVENTANLLKKHEQIKVKLQNIKNFNKKSEGLISTKTDIVNHQNEQIRITIRNINSQINNIYGSIQHSLNQSIKLIQKAKQRQNINLLFAESLDKLLKQIEQSKASNQYIEARSQIRSRRSDSARNNKAKKQSQEAIQKSLPLRVAQTQNQMPQPQQATLIKPKFTKNKVPEDSKLNVENRNVNNQRIWKQQQQRKANAVKSQEENKLKINNQNQPADKKSNLEDEKKDKSKPFTLKKNKQKPQNTNSLKQNSFGGQSINNLQENPSPKNNNQLEIKQEVAKQQTITPALGPRMMRFARKKNQQQNSNNNIVLNDSKNSQPAQNTLKISLQNKKQEGLKLQLQIPSKQTAPNDQKPIFVPKRFNLRNKAQKKDDSYTPSVQSVQKSQSPSNLNKKQQKAKQIKQQEYKPKFDFKNQEFKIEEKIVPKKQPQKQSITIPQSDVKPKFNLRLRDRKNKVEEQGSGYMPTVKQQKTAQNGIKLQIKDSKMNAQNQIKNNSQTKVLNPYAPKNQIVTNNPYAPSNNPTNNAPNNPYAPSNNNNINANSSSNKNPYAPSNNPYAPKVNNEGQSTNVEAPKRERGPLKKEKNIKENAPQQKFNIYAQAEDMTQAVKTIGGQKPLNLNVSNDKQTLNLNINNQTSKKKEQLNLNQMLGLKKQVKKNDFDDLLGDIGTKNTKNKKKNNDFFGDLQL